MLYSNHVIVFDNLHASFFFFNLLTKVQVCQYQKTF